MPHRRSSNPLLLALVLLVARGAEANIISLGWSHSCTSCIMHLPKKNARMLPCEKQHLARSASSAEWAAERVLTTYETTTTVEL